jgi:hypothetical protein
VKNLLENTLSEAKANDVKALSILINDMDMRSISYKYAYSYGYREKYDKDN